MYLWKAWHDCRARIIFYILAAVSVGVLCGMEMVATINNYRAFLILHAYRQHTKVPFFNFDLLMDVTFWTLHGTLLGYRFAWNLSYNALPWDLLGYGSIAMVLAGLGLGATSVGREDGSGTMTLVLTRPCQRAKFIFTDWTIGLTSMVIILSGLAFPLFFFLCAAHAKGPGNVLAGLPPLWVLGAAIYGLAHFTTLVSGSASKGLTLSVATILSYSFLPAALKEWWHTDVLFRATEWTLGAFRSDAWPLSPFDWGATVFWLLVAGGFLGASLAWIRRREV